MIHATRTRTRTTRVVNPRTAPKPKAHKARKAKPKKHRKARPAAPAKGRNPNPAETVVLGFLNPEKRTMARAKGKKKNPQKKRRRARNPQGGLARLVMRPVQILYMGMLAAVGFLLTRQLPQLALKTNNRGLLGYGANLLTAAVTSGAAYRFIGPTEGTATLIGGSLYLFNRLVSEQTPLGKQLQLSGVGDVQASGSLGALVSAYFPHPVVYDAQGRPVIPAAIQDAIQGAVSRSQAATAAAVAPSAAETGIGMAGRFQSRFM
jgi:hypothetical protein